MSCILKVLGAGARTRIKNLRRAMPKPINATPNLVIKYSMKF